MTNIYLLCFLGNSQQQPNVVPSLATIAGNEIPLASSSIPTRPPFYSLNAAAAATSSTMGNTYYTYQCNVFLI